MATVQASESTHGRYTAFATAGNLSRLVLPMETNAAGALIGSNQKTALLIADKVKLLRIPKGTLIGLGTDIVISNAFTALTTISVGFEYADGVDDAAFPQSTTFFLAAGGATSALGRLNTTPNVAPQVLNKDAWLIVTIAGADHAEAGRMDVMIDAIYQGIRGME